MSTAAKTQAGSSGDLKWYLNGAIAIAIMLFFRYIPAVDPITQDGMAVLGLFLGCIYAWCTVDLIWPSIFALVLFGYTAGAKNMTLGWGSLISNPTVTLALWLMISIGILSSTGMVRYVARWSITRSWTEGRPWVLFHTVMAADIICSAVVGGIATIVLFFALVTSICSEVGYKKGDKMAAFFFFAVGFYSTIGNMLMPFHTAIIANFGFMAAGSDGVYDGSFNYGSYMVFAFITIFAIYLTSFLFFKYIVKPDATLLKNYKPSGEIEPLDKRQKLALFMFALMFVLFVIPSFLPKGTAVAALCAKFGIAGPCMIVVGLSCFLRVDGKPFVTFKTLMNDMVLWQVILMFGTALTLVTFLNSQDAGFGAYIKGVLNPILGDLSGFAFVAVFMIIALIATNLVNNTVVSALMLPTAFTFCMDMGINPVALTACFVMFVDFAILLPSSSPCGALMHSSEGWLPKKYLYGFGVAGLLIALLCTLLIGWPLANALMPYVG